jgi:hypothetical protein
MGVKREGIHPRCQLHRERFRAGASLLKKSRATVIPASHTGLRAQVWTGFRPESRADVGLEWCSQRQPGLVQQAALFRDDFCITRSCVNLGSTRVISSVAKTAQPVEKLAGPGLRTHLMARGGSESGQIGPSDALHTPPRIVALTFSTGWILCETGSFAVPP